MARYVAGLLIRGLSYAGSEQPTLFVDGDLDASTLPSPLSTSTQIVGRLSPIGSIALSSSIREPVGAGGEIRAELQDDATGTLAAYFAGDPAFTATSLWTLSASPTLSNSATGLTLTGSTAPTTGQIVLLDQEAIKIGTVSTSGNVHTITGCTRARCGSLARTHALDPASYAGDNGKHQALVASSRMLFDDVQYEAQIFHFRMKEEDPSAVAALEFAWFGHITSRPTFDPATLRWSIPVAHVSQRIRDWRLPGARDVEAARCMVLTGSLSAGNGGDLAPPGVTGGSAGSDAGGALLTGNNKAFIRLTAYEFERLFGVVVHNPGSTAPVESLINAANTKLTTNAKVSYQLDTEIGGYRWIWRVTAILPRQANVGGSAAPTHVFVYGSLESAEKGASASDQPVQFPHAGGSGGASRQDGLNAGFCKSVLNDLVRTRQGETPPKLTVRVRLRMTFVEALLMLCLSGWGGGADDATYDTILGGRGLHLDPAWVNTGSAPVSPLSVSEGTTALLELKALLGEVYDYTLQAGDSLADFLNNELRLHCLLLSFVPTTGKLAARLWARKRPASPTALNPVVWPDGEVTDLRENLQPIRALLLARGIHPVTLEPRFLKPVQMPEAKARDVAEAITIRVWKEGGAILDQELETGALARLERAFFGVTRGRPSVWRVPLEISAGLVFGDLVTLTEPSIPTASGMGVTALPVIVVGLDRDMESGRLIAHVMQDVVNQAAEASASTGKRAPALKITASVNTSGATYELTVTAPGDGSFNITTSYGGIFQDLADDGGRVRIVNPARHNPTAENEIPGPLECSAEVDSVSHVAGVNKITVTIPVAWTRGGFTTGNLVEVGGFVCLQNLRPAATNPEGATIQGHASQGYDSGSGRDFAVFSPVSRKPRFDSRRSLIGA
jgi:hypothetical protein